MRSDFRCTSQIKVDQAVRRLAVGVLTPSISPFTAPMTYFNTNLKCINHGKKIGSYVEIQCASQAETV